MDFENFIIRSNDSLRTENILNQTVNPDLTYFNILIL